MRWTAPLHWLRYRWMLRRKNPSTAPIRKVGIYKPDRLGDFVLATGAIHRIVEQEGAENCLLIVSRFSRALVEAQFPHVECVEIEPWQNSLEAAREYLAMHRQDPLFKYGVDRLVCLRHHRCNLEALIFSSIPARATWGCLNSELMRESGLFITPSVFDHLFKRFPLKSDDSRELSRHRVVTSHFLGKSPDELDITPFLKSKASWTGAYAAVSPFGSSKIRDFPPALLQAAGNHLWCLKGIPLRMLAPPGDKTRYDALAADLHKAGLPSVTIQICETTNELVDAIASSQIVLSVETATAHIAATLDRPLVALLGGGHHGWFAPWRKSNRQIWLSHHVPCFHCSWACSQPEPICITQVKSKAVETAVEQVLV